MKIIDVRYIMNMTAVVTGGSGYIGSKLVAFLLKEGFSVYCITRPTTDYNKLPEHSSIHFLEYDGQIESIHQKIYDIKPDVVFHLAAVGNAVHDAKMIEQMVSANIVLGVHLLEILSKIGSGIFINTGTFWQFYQGDENYNPNSLYAATKQAFQDIMLYYTNTFSLSAVSLILYDVYGEADPRGKLFNLLINAAKQSLTIPMSPGEQKIIPVYVDDVVDAFYLTYQLLNKAQLQSGAKYHVASDRGYSIKEIVDAFKTVSQGNFEVSWGARAYRDREIMNPFVGEKLPSWQQKVSLKEGLGKIWLAGNEL
ncbi:NAD-dependent epimerase/dehydratase family protein [Thiotrichales bacterium 19S11-10]|nr:NAD-dependent epimerase/dehydratase family protein [Thiotrichales bacterium 19S11-10]